MSWFRRLQNEPKRVRETIAFGGALVIALVILVVWIISLPSRLGQTETTAIENPTEELSNFTSETQERWSQLMSVFSSAPVGTDESAVMEPGNDQTEPVHTARVESGSVSTTSNLSTSLNTSTVPTTAPATIDRSEQSILIGTSSATATEVSTTLQTE